jgi:hypothetical protein
MSYILFRLRGAIVGKVSGVQLVELDDNFGELMEANLQFPLTQSRSARDFRSTGVIQSKTSENQGNHDWPLFVAYLIATT